MRVETWVDGEMVSVEDVDLPPHVPTHEEALATAVQSVARLTVTDKVKAEELDDATLTAIAPVFPAWAPGQAVVAGEVLRWDGTLVEVIQAHTTQADWQPDQVPALFKIHRRAGAAPAEFVQPTGGHDAYAIGDRVTFQGQVYESLIAANVYSPTAYPAGWRLIG